MNDKNVQAENLKIIRKTHGLTQQALADSLGEKQTKIKDIESCNQKMTLEFATKVEKIYNVNFRWLLTGEGSMYEQASSKDVCYNLPVRGNVLASMGYGVMVYNEEQTGTYAISKQLATALKINPKSSEIIFASGNSMEPTIERGDSLLVDNSRTIIHDGRIYCIKLDGELYAKRLQKLEKNKILIISDNPQYKTREVQPGDDFNIIGEVRWWGRIAK